MLRSWRREIEIILKSRFRSSKPWTPMINCLARIPMNFDRCKVRGHLFARLLLQRKRDAREVQVAVLRPWHKDCASLPKYIHTINSHNHQMSKIFSKVKELAGVVNEEKRGCHVASRSEQRSCSQKSFGFIRYRHI